MSHPLVSPARRKTIVGLTNRDMNRFDDSNLTLPITKGDHQRTKHKRGVSMGGAEMLSQTQLLRRQAKPRKSILKAATEERPDEYVNQTGEAVDHGATIDFGQLRQFDRPRPSMPSMPSGNSRMSLGPRRRVSFAPAAHVRMFDQPDKRPRRKSSMLPRQFGNSNSNNSQSPSRSRTSLSMPAPAQAAPPSPRARFLGEGEGESEASMDIESEASYSSTADSDDILAQVQAISPARPTAPAPPLDSSSDAGSEMDMDETVIGGGIVENRWASDESGSDSESDADSEHGEQQSDEEKTMDFTVALGGPMPRIPPQDAQRGRASIGYSVPSAPGQEPFLPGEGADDGSLDMEETVAYGVVYHDESTSSSENSNRAGDHTATYNMDFTTIGGGIINDDSGMDMTMTTVHGGIEGADESGMDFTTAGGGIAHQTEAYDESGMDFTTAGGGIAQNTGAYAESELDFTTAGGGIADKNTAAYGATATMNMTTNIFAPAQTPKAPTPEPAQPTTTPATRVNIFAPTPATSGIPRPRQSIKPALTPFAPVSAPVEEPEETPDEHVPTSPPIRHRGSSATPARPTPGSSRKHQPAPVGTPSFARPTSSSTQKSHPSAQKAPASAQKKKRNIFGASPEPEDEPLSQSSRSKSRTPRKSIAGLETAASVAKKLDFSAPVSVASTPVANLSAQTTPKSAIPSVVTPKTSTPRAPTPKVVTPKLTPKAPSTSTTPKTTNPVSAPSSLKRTREEALEEPQEEVDELHRDKRRRSVTASVPTPVDTPVESISTEEDMSLEESEDADTPTEESWNTRQVTPEQEDRPLPSYTPIQRGTPGRMTPRKSLGTPRKSMLGPPRRSMLATAEPIIAEPEPEPSPPVAEPAAPVDLMTHLPSQPGIEVQNIPLAAFLEMVGISWQDDLIGRKSMAFTDNLKSAFPKGHEFPLPDYVEANLESVFLSMLSWANGEITARTSQGREILTTIERVCNEANPPVVHDYLAADEEDRGMFESVLLQIKSVTYLRARARWYDWKQSILSEKVEADVRGIRDDMLADAERHAAERKTIDKVLPDLRKRRDELEAELAAHRAQVEAVLACDADEIAALREGIEEQETELERFRAELDDKNARNSEVEEQLLTLEKERAAHALAIDAARSMCDQATVGDVLRLDAELSALQSLHGWQILRAGARTELAYNDLLVTIPPEVERTTLSLSSAAPSDMDAGLLVLAQACLHNILGQGTIKSLRALVSTISHLWSSVRRVKDELRRLSLYYPASYEVQGDALVVTALLVLPKARARAALSMTLTPEVLVSWPEAARVLPVNVEAGYGRVDTQGLGERAKETLGSADLSLAGALVLACAEAAALYA